MQFSPNARAELRRRSAWERQACTAFHQVFLPFPVAQAVAGQLGSAPARQLALAYLLLILRGLSGAAPPLIAPVSEPLDAARATPLLKREQCSAGCCVAC